MRWALALQGYDYIVQDISEKNNVAADYLSRVMNSSCLVLQSEQLARTPEPPLPKRKGTKPSSVRSQDREEEEL